ncbi:hypothetical protein NUACC21_75010 [Scytonema sp. NUACC21]
MSIKLSIRKYLGRKLGLPEIPFALERLSDLGFQPQSIFDIGAYRGDFALSCLHIWQNSKIACFEALEHKVTQLLHLASHNSSISVFPTLVGAEACDRVPLYEAETASSILAEHISQSFPVKFYPMTTVDRVVQEDFYGSSPDLLKLDVQGYELEVLKGAEKSLPQMQVILAEVNFLDIHKGVALVAEVITWLNERDWVAYDICGLTRRPIDKALWQADLLFVPRNSPLRADKRWAA